MAGGGLSMPLGRVCSAFSVIHLFGKYFLARKVDMPGEWLKPCSLSHSPHVLGVYYRYTDMKGGSGP